MKDVKSIILRQLEIHNEISVKDIVKKTGFSQPYIFRFIQDLTDEGKIVRIGKARNSRYIQAHSARRKEFLKDAIAYSTVVKNSGIEESEVLLRIKKETGIFTNIKKNVQEIIEYSFTEILNNAIEHSGSETIEIKMERSDNDIKFDIKDRGIGIYSNIKQKFGLHDEFEAIGELVKGKLTTAKSAHSGEGIFFTSKAVDNMLIQSSTKKLIFNNIVDDIFIRNIKPHTGTRVTCNINLKSQKDLVIIFKTYEDEDFEFSKTRVTVKLYRMGTDYISRSQARRLITGLDKFKEIILDFKGVESVGQGFADEIFRVWKSSHPGIEIKPVNQNDNVNFMIKRSVKSL